MDRIVAIDPGSERSAYVFLDDGVPGAHAWLANDHLLDLLAKGFHEGRLLAIETLFPRAEPVSRDALAGQLWAGRFIQAVLMSGQNGQVVESARFICVDPGDSRFCVTHNPQAGDKHIRVGLLNIFGDKRQEPCDCGDGREPGKRPGTTRVCRKCGGERFVTVPGPLDGFNEHERSALAVAVYVHEKRSLATSEPTGGA